MSYTKHKKEDFEKKIKEKYPNEDLTVILYTGAKEKGIIKCNKCNNEYELKNASNFLEKSKKKVCNKCFPRNDTVEMGHKVKYLVSKTNNLVLLNDYTKITDNLEFKCNHCEKTFKRMPQVFLKTQKCPYCESFSSFKGLDTFKIELKEKLDGEYSIVGDYLGTNKKTLFRHNDCGFIFKESPHMILGKKPCPKCKRFHSKGEKKIEKILTEHKIAFEKQKRFPEDLHLLSFDFYIESQKLLIEFQGEQHYKPIKHFGGEEKFKKQQLNDEKKREFCKNNNYSLLEISYDKIDEIENVLSFLWLND